jgi:hypothetical protein
MRYSRISIIRFLPTPNILLAAAECTCQSDLRVSTLRKIVEVMVENLKIRAILPGEPERAMRAIRARPPFFAGKCLLLEKRQYMHNNPVTRGLAASPDGWLWA